MTWIDSEHWRTEMLSLGKQGRWQAGCWKIKPDREPASVILEGKPASQGKGERGERFSRTFCPFLRLITSFTEHSLEQFDLIWLLKAVWPGSRHVLQECARFTFKTTSDKWKPWYNVPVYLKKAIKQSSNQEKIHNKMPGCRYIILKPITLKYWKSKIPAY